MMLVPDIIRDIYPDDNQTSGMATGTQTTEFLHLLNPKNYKFLPPQYIGQIRDAGKSSTR